MNDFSSPDDHRDRVIAIPAQRAPADPERPRLLAVPCRCGHPREFHEHYRAGADCGACGPGRCVRYQVAARPVEWDLTSSHFNV